MEQFRHIGKVLGDLKALMVFRDDIQVNQRQCCLLFDIYTLAYEGIAGEIKRNLRFEERQTKWKALEHPLKELHRIFKEGALYIQHCLETKDLWAKAISLAQNTDCVEFHIHNFMCCIPVVIEAIEMTGEIAGCDQHMVQKKRTIISSKYDNEWKDPKLFQWKFGKQYMVSQEICNRLETSWKEDRWILIQTIKDKRSSQWASLSKQEQRLTELLLKKLEDSSESPNVTMFPASLLVGSKDYQVRRRLGNGGQYKEIQWLGESFVVRQFFEDIGNLLANISILSSITHPNIMHFLCGFYDEEKKEGFLVMELMNKDLHSYIKEICGPRKRIPFSLPVAVDLMLQIARGMEYLHSHKIYHGDLNPFNILIRVRNSPEGYLHAKVSGYQLCSFKNFSSRNSSNQQETHPFIWYAPEVLLEQEQPGNICNFQYTDKADVYSFGMICFELLTGKLPFEEGHLQGDKMSKNIRAGERPLFPSFCSKYLTCLTKKCWHTDPIQRPSFSSICRILRYIKRFLLMNPDHSQSDGLSPLIDYCDIEMVLSKKFGEWGIQDPTPVSQIPFHMFAYRVLEKEKISMYIKERSSESGSDGASLCGDDNLCIVDDPFSPMVVEMQMPTLSMESPKRRTSMTKKCHSAKQPGTPRGRSVRPPQLTTLGRNYTMNSEGNLSMMISPHSRRRIKSGHSSDSELP